MTVVRIGYSRLTIPFRPPGPVIHYSELAPATPGSPLAEEWETFRRELPELLASGLAGKHVFVVGTEVVGQCCAHDCRSETP